LTQKQRIEAFVALGDFLKNDHTSVDRAVEIASIKNPWYTPENTRKQLEAIVQNLTFDKLSHWLAPYPDVDTNKSVGLILAGNIPLVGFHDILAVLVSGYRAKIKLSSDDAGLTTFVLHALQRIDPALIDKIHIVERLQDFDLVIATGSDNSSRYFTYYFGNRPHIIRKNRNSVALLNGNESGSELEALGVDIFSYFGLGCRSVSKLYLPENYEISIFYEALEKFKSVKDHHKYANNYDYYKSIYLINGEPHFDNGFVLLKADSELASPLATVFYETYSHTKEVVEKLHDQTDKIQCLVSQSAIQTNIPTFSFGQSQCPALTDYADGINTLDFLFANI